MKNRSKLFFAVLTAILIHCDSGVLLKASAQMALRGVAEISGDFTVSIFGVNQQVLGQFYFFTVDIVRDRDSFEGVKELRQIIGIDVQLPGNITNPQLFMEMRKNIGFAVLCISAGTLFLNIL